MQVPDRKACESSYFLETAETDRQLLKRISNLAHCRLQILEVPGAIIYQ